MIMNPLWQSGLQGRHAVRVPPPNPLYVDTVAGTVNGVGTLSSPINSLYAAALLCSGLPDWVIKVNAPITSPVRQEISYESSMSLTIEGIDGKDWYAYGSDPITNVWNKVGNVYSKVLSYSLLTQVVVTSVPETIDDTTFFKKLMINTVTPTTPGLGEFGYQSGTLYVRMWDDSSPASHTFEIARRNTCIGTVGFGPLTIKNVVAAHALVNGLRNGRAGQPLGTGRLFVEDSTAIYCMNGGVGAAGQNEETICTRVKAYRVANDGFNHHALTGAAYMELRDCDGSFNGDKAGQSAQGASNHESTVMVIKGGKYNSNVSGGMVVINTARCDIDGSTKWGPVVMDKNMRLGNTPGPVSTQAGCAWLDSSTGVVTGDVSVTNGLGVGVRRSPTSVVTNIASIKSVGNALPDIL